MEDMFLRQRLNVITGLTRYKTGDNSVTGVTPNQWTDLFTFSDPTTHKLITGYKVSLSSGVSVGLFRVLARPVDGNPLTDSDKIFPYGLSISIENGEHAGLIYPLQIPINYIVKFQVNLDGTGSLDATLNYTNYIEVPTYSHA